MDARSYFDGVRAAQRSITGRLAAIAAMRAREAVRARRYEAIGRASGGGDAMRATDARIDAEESARTELAELEAEVEAGRAVCRGVRAANPRSRWGDVLELRWCEDLQWCEVAAALDVSQASARAECSAALEWIDAVGLARAREGMGQATLF